MKKYSAFFLILVLIAAMVTGCGCRNTRPANTVPTTMPTTMPATVPTTQPTLNTTEAAETTRETIEDGNGPLPTNATAGADGDTSSATETTPMEDASRRVPRSSEK